MRREEGFFLRVVFSVHSHSLQLPSGPTEQKTVFITTRPLPLCPERKSVCVCVCVCVCVSCDDISDSFEFGGEKAIKQRGAELQR